VGSLFDCRGGWDYGGGDGGLGGIGLRIGSEG
jgi:hypothetical protein